MNNVSNPFRFCQNCGDGLPQPAPGHRRCDACLTLDNVLWLEDERAVIRAERRAGEDRRAREPVGAIVERSPDQPADLRHGGERRSSTREVRTLAHLIEDAWDGLEAGELELEVGLSRIASLERQLEAYRYASSGHRHEIADRIHELERAHKATRNYIVTEYERTNQRLGALEEHAAPPAEIMDRLVACEARIQTTSSGASECIIALEKAVGRIEKRLVKIEKLRGMADPWTGAGGVPVAREEEDVDPVQERALLEDELEQPERREGERRSEPYRCVRSSCGGELEVRGSSGVGSKLYVCTECERADLHRTPGDRRGATWDQCAMCDARTPDPLAGGDMGIWRWARFDTEDATVGVWLCPEHRGEFYDREVIRCNTCGEWTDAVDVEADPELVGGVICGECRAARVSAATWGADS